MDFQSRFCHGSLPHELYPLPYSERWKLDTHITRPVFIMDERVQVIPRLTIIVWFRGQSERLLFLSGNNIPKNIIFFDFLIEAISIPLFRRPRSKIHFATWYGIFLVDPSPWWLISYWGEFVSRWSNSTLQDESCASRTFSKLEFKHEPTKTPTKLSPFQNPEYWIRWLVPSIWALGLRF